VVVFNVLEEVVKDTLTFAKALPIHRPKLTVLDYLGGDLSRPLEDFECKTLFKPIEKGEVTYRRVIGLDASSTSVSTYGIELAAAAGTIYWGQCIYYPRISLRDLPIPFISYLGDKEGLPGVTTSYIKLGIKYREDKALPEGALEHDVRISMETYLMALSKRVFRETIILIDGPIYYPIYHSENLRSRWNDELHKLNEERVKMFKELTEEGFIPLAIVKRIETSKYLPTKYFGKDRDVNVLNRYLIKLRPPHKPLRTPFFIYEKAHLGPDRVFTYVAIPRSVVKGSYGIFRIEMLKETYESIKPKSLSELVTFLTYSSLNNRFLIPIKLLEADRISKSLVRMLKNYIIKRFEFYGLSVPYELRGEMK